MKEQLVLNVWEEWGEDSFLGEEVSDVEDSTVLTQAEKCTLRCHHGKP